jgi:hypothetical protein
MRRKPVPVVLLPPEMAASGLSNEQLTEAIARVAVFVVLRPGEKVILSADKAEVVSEVR